MNLKPNVHIGNILCVSGDGDRQDRGTFCVCLETATVEMGEHFVCVWRRRTSRSGWVTEMSKMAVYLNRRLCVAGVRKKRRLLTVATERVSKGTLFCVFCDQNLVFAVPEFLSCQGCEGSAVPMLGTCSTL